MNAKTLGLIHYLAFLAFFVSLVATLWTYSYEATLVLGSVQTKTYPYRNYTIPLGLTSSLLFVISIYFRTVKAENQNDNQ